MTTQRIPKVLVVDDDDDVHLFINHVNAACGSPVGFEHAHDIAEAVAKLNETCFDAALIDVRLPGVTGISLGALVREHDVNIPLAYLTNLDSEAVRREAVSQRAFFLFKHRFFGVDGGMEELLNIVCEMTKLNPCKVGGTRVDNYGFPRQTDHTPIEVPAVLNNLLQYSRSLAAAA